MESTSLLRWSKDPPHSGQMELTELKRWNPHHYYLGDRRVPSTCPCHLQDILSKLWDILFQVWRFVQKNAWHFVPNLIASSLKYRRSGVMKFEQNPRYYDILFNCGGGGYDLSVFLDDVSSSKMNIHWLPLRSLSYIIYLASYHAYFHRELVPVRLSAFVFLVSLWYTCGCGRARERCCCVLRVERRICCGVVMLMVQTQYLSRRPRVGVLPSSSCQYFWCWWVVMSSGCAVPRCTGSLPPPPLPRHPSQLFTSSLNRVRVFGEVHVWH